MDAITERLERRRARAPRTPGATAGAKRLYALYYSADPAQRERLIEGVARHYSTAPDPLQRAADLLGKWARGKRCPSLASRRILAKVAKIAQRAWDEVPA